MSSKRSFLILTLLLVIAGMSVQAIVPVFAANGDGPNCYGGIYFSNYATIYQTQNVIMGYNFPYSWSPSGWGSQWVAGVMSVAGYYSGTTPSSFWYQNGAGLGNNGAVSWSPQLKKWSTGQSWYYGSQVIGTVSAVSYYMRINRIGVNDFQFKAYVYSTFTQFEHDAPSIYTWNLPHDTVFNDGGFLVGCQWDPYNVRFYRHLQFGWESSMQVPVNSAWYFQNFGMGYKSGSSWKYQPGATTNWFYSDILWYVDGGNLHGIRVGLDYMETVRFIGGSTDSSMYHGHSADNSFDDFGITVWSSSGNTPHGVNTPYA